MSKNLIPEIAKMLGVELGEEFKIKGHEELTYRFAGDRLQLTYDNNIELSDLAAKVAFVALLNGKDEIVKLPWKPKMNERYWSFMVRRNYAAPDKIEWSPAISIWTEHPTDLALLDKGWVYRTRAEAATALPAVTKEMGVEYEI